MVATTGARSLGAVHRLVGTVQQLLGRLRPETAGDPDAGAEREPGERRTELFDAGDDAAGDVGRTRLVGRRHDREEFVSTEPADADALGHLGGNAMGDVAEHTVTRLVPERV